MKVKIPNFIIYVWYLSAIEIIDTQVARRGRQYHRNPPPYKNRPTKKNRIYKTKPTQHHRRPTQPNTTTAQHHHHHATVRAYKKNRPTKKKPLIKIKLVTSNKIK